jgi:DNA polymerase-1
MGSNKFRTVAFTDYGIKLSFKEAEQWRRNFFATYPGILNWHDKRKREAHQTKQVVSLYGRSRHLPMIDSDDQNIVSLAERMSVNAPIQSASSDSAVLAALEASRKKRLDFSRARLVLFVHDELVYEVEDSYVPTVAEVIKYELEHLPTKEFGFELAVPTKAGCEIGPNLAEMKEYTP